MHWTITGVKPASLPQTVLKHVVSRDFILKNFVHGTSSVSWRNLWHCFISDFSMSFYITFQKKTLACGSQEGHIRPSVGQWVTKCDPLSTLLPAIMRSGPHAAGLPNATYSVLIRRTLSARPVLAMKLPPAPEALDTSVVSHGVY